MQVHGVSTEMTPFDVEKEVSEIILNAENGPKAHAMVLALCRKVRDEALEEVITNFLFTKCRFREEPCGKCDRCNDARLALQIRSLKTSEQGKKGG